MSYQPQTEAATSRFLNVDEGGRTLRIHINDCGDGKETVVMLHGSGPGPPAGPTSAAILTRWSRRAIACCSSTVRGGAKAMLSSTAARVRTSTPAF